MDFTSNAVRTKAPNFVHLGLPEVNALDELIHFGTPATRVRRLMGVPHWFAPGHAFGEVTAIGMSGKRSEQNYS